MHGISDRQWPRALSPSTGVSQLTSISRFLRLKHRHLTASPVSIAAPRVLCFRHATPSLCRVQVARSSGFFYQVFNAFYCRFLVDSKRTSMLPERLSLRDRWYKVKLWYTKKMLHLRLQPRLYCGEARVLSRRKRNGHEANRISLDEMAIKISNRQSSSSEPDCFDR